MKISIICNGFSEEKGISINSSKTIYEILEYNPNITKIEIIFIDNNKKFFILEKEFIFSNTMEDFIHNYQKKKPLEKPMEYLKSFDKIILTTHGNFGEDGDLQHMLESHMIEYIGPSQYTARNTFFKLETLETLWKHKICQPWTGELFTTNERVEQLLAMEKKLCIKPNNGGSSIGVRIVSSVEEAILHIEFLQNNDYTPLLESVHKGIEFSINVINGNVDNPTEIITEGIFTYEKKYFPSHQVSYKHPASFNTNTISKIKEDSIKIYHLFKCKNLLRIDGFYDRENNKIIYTDLNTIPGFQLNGLFFKYKYHFDVINELLGLPKRERKFKKQKKLIYVIFGGDSREQNVSIMSGTNIIFNLNKQFNYDVQNYLLYNNKFWPMDYKECFQTSIEDFKSIIKNIQPLNLIDFIERAKERKAVIFNGLHGHIGENGTLQYAFEQNNIPYTGSNSQISQLCMNKYKTLKYISKYFSKDGDFFFPHTLLLKNFAKYGVESVKALWPSGGCCMFIRPNDDGCSVGSKIIRCVDELLEYHHAIVNKWSYLGSLPLSLKSKDYILQEYIVTDKIRSKNNQIIINANTHWFEGTVGTIGKRVLTPSLCIAKNELLTMEEKFLQGTGINLTPIPQVIVNKNHIQHIKKIVEKIRKFININTYCRMDYFYNTKNKKFILIEINTLPALTPATVLFQQAIYNNLSPRLFINKILTLIKKT